VTGKTIFHQHIGKSSATALGDELDTRTYLFSFGLVLYD